ncbi:DUF2690 domain-containing protein [Streptomyces sp. NPDC059352]|uniref:DUF2690 domain-containing protein n=1 Tax=Streptomyces sp. NPDC059352 TaxID=3346810 RepID=UPI0036802308
MRTRRWGRAGAALTALCLSPMLAAPQASATETDPGCYAESCQGKDPYALGCDWDAELLAQLNKGNDLEVRLVYSDSCHAVWVNASLNPAYTGQEQLYVELWSTPTIGGAQSPKGTTKYLTRELPVGNTLMGDWQGTNKACWNNQGSHWDPAPLDYEGSGGNMPRMTGACTAWQ